MAALRAGPTSGTTIKPPLGIGSLGIETKDGTEKVAWGDSVDFAGDPVSGLNQVGFSWFQTGEDYDRFAANAPNITLEINPSVANKDYTSMVYVPAAPASRQAEQWINDDADTNPGGTSGWYFTNGSVAAATLAARVAGSTSAPSTEARTRSSPTMTAVPPPRSAPSPSRRARTTSTRAPSTPCGSTAPRSTSSRSELRRSPRRSNGSGIGMGTGRPSGRPVLFQFTRSL